MKDHVHLATGKIFPRGAKPTPRHLLCGAMPFRATVTPPPFYGIFPGKLSMWGNGPDSNWPDPGGDGDCVSAEEAFNKACKGIFIEDKPLYDWCVANGTLNGANLQPVIQQMQASGFKQDGNVYGDGEALSINYADIPTMQAAIYTAGQTGGCVKFALAADELPSGAGNNNGWFMTSDSPDQNYDHCMAANFYGTAQQFVDAMNAAYPGLGLTLPSGVSPTLQGVAVFTWATIGFCSWPAFINMTGEAWIRSPSTVITGTGTPTSDPVYVAGGSPTPPPVCPPGQHPDPVTGQCVPDNPTPPPVNLTVTIPDQVIQVPGFFVPHSVTVKGGTYPCTPTSVGASALVLPPQVLVILQEVCAVINTLPTSTNLYVMMAESVAKAICAALPVNHPAMAAAGLSVGITLPPWVLPMLKFLCPFASFIPAPYGPLIVSLCALLPAQGKPCGCS